jgi:hypothetical protein
VKDEDSTRLVLGHAMRLLEHYHIELAKVRRQIHELEASAGRAGRDSDGARLELMKLPPIPESELFGPARSFGVMQVLLGSITTSQMARICDALNPEQVVLLSEIYTSCATSSAEKTS